MPSLARDMQDPSQFDHAINWAFVSKLLPGLVKYLSIIAGNCYGNLRSYWCSWISYVW